MRNGKKMNIELVKKYINKHEINDLMNEMRMIGLELNEEEKEEIRECFNTKFLKDSSILLDDQYDNYLKLWFGDHKWRLIYRASEHGYSAHSFHDYCDNKGSTIVIIKSTGG